MEAGLQRAFRIRVAPGVVGVLLAALAYAGVVGNGAFNVTLGVCASLVATVGWMLAQEDRRFPRHASLARNLTPAAVLSTAYFAVGCWVLYAGYDAPARGYVESKPLSVFTVIASGKDPLHHEAVLEHFVGRGVDTALLELSVVDDPRVRRIDVQVLEATGKQEPRRTRSPLHAGVQLDGLQGVVVKLRVSAEVIEPIPDTSPVNLLVHAEHGERDLVWHIVNWFHQRYPTRG